MCYHKWQWALSSGLRIISKAHLIKKILVSTTKIYLVLKSYLQILSYQKLSDKKFGYKKNRLNYLPRYLFCLVMDRVLEVRFSDSSMYTESSKKMGFEIGKNYLGFRYPIRHLQLLTTLGKFLWNMRWMLDSRNRSYKKFRWMDQTFLNAILYSIFLTKYALSDEFESITEPILV